MSRLTSSDEALAWAQSDVKLAPAPSMADYSDPEWAKTRLAEIVSDDDEEVRAIVQQILEELERSPNKKTPAVVSLPNRRSAFPG